MIGLLTDVIGKVSEELPLNLLKDESEIKREPILDDEVKDSDHELEKARRLRNISCDDATLNPKKNTLKPNYKCMEDSDSQEDCSSFEGFSSCGLDSSPVKPNRLLPRKPFNKSVCLKFEQSSGSEKENEHVLNIEDCDVNVSSNVPNPVDKDSNIDTNESTNIFSDDFIKISPNIPDVEKIPKCNIINPDKDVASDSVKPNSDCLAAGNDTKTNSSNLETINPIPNVLPSTEEADFRTEENTSNNTVNSSSNNISSCTKDNKPKEENIIHSSKPDVTSPERDAESSVSTDAGNSNNKTPSLLAADLLLQIGLPVDSKECHPVKEPSDEIAPITDVDTIDDKLDEDASDVSMTSVGHENVADVSISSDVDSNEAKPTPDTTSIGDVLNSKEIIPDTSMTGNYDEGISKENLLDSDKTSIDDIKVISKENLMDLDKTIIDDAKVISEENLLDSDKTSIDDTKVIFEENLMDSDKTSIDDTKVISEENLMDSDKTCIDDTKVISEENLMDTDKTSIDDAKVISDENLKVSEETGVDDIKVDSKQDLPGHDVSSSDEVMTKDIVPDAIMTSVTDDSTKEDAVSNVDMDESNDNISDLDNIVDDVGSQVKNEESINEPSQPDNSNMKEDLFNFMEDFASIAEDLDVSSEDACKSHEVDCPEENFDSSKSENNSNKGSSSQSKECNAMSDDEFRMESLNTESSKTEMIPSKESSSQSKECNAMSDDEFRIPEGNIMSPSFNSQKSHNQDSDSQVDMDDKFPGPRTPEGPAPSSPSNLSPENSPRPLVRTRNNSSEYSHPLPSILTASPSITTFGKTSRKIFHEEPNLHTDFDRPPLTTLGVYEKEPPLKSLQANEIRRPSTLGIMERSLHHSVLDKSCSSILGNYDRKFSFQDYEKDATTESSMNVSRPSFVTSKIAGSDRYSSINNFMDRKSPSVISDRGLINSSGVLDRPKTSLLPDGSLFPSAALGRPKTNLLFDIPLLTSPTVPDKPKVFEEQPDQMDSLLELEPCGNKPMALAKRKLSILEYRKRRSHSVDGRSDTTSPVGVSSPVYSAKLAYKEKKNYPSNVRRNRECWNRPSYPSGDDKKEYSAEIALKSCSYQDDGSYQDRAAKHDSFSDDSGKMEANSPYESPRASPRTPPPLPPSPGNFAIESFDLLFCRSI